MHVTRKLNEWLGCTLYGLILFCGVVAAAEEVARPDDRPDVDASNASAATQRPQQKGDEDILDRVFAPLDEAVDDINRSLNEDQKSAPAPSNE